MLLHDRHLLSQGEMAERFAARRRDEPNFRDHVLIEYESIRPVPMYDSSLAMPRHPHDNSNNSAFWSH